MVGLHLYADRFSLVHRDASWNTNKQELEGNLFNWPHASRGATQKAQERAAEIDRADLDYGLFSTNDAFIKVWLPDRLTSAIDRLSTVHQSSRPDVLRSILFKHIYGAMAFEGFVDWKHQLDARRRAASASAGSSTAQFSPRRSDGIEVLGKSDTNFKFWIPAKLKQDLSLLAKADGLGISDYVRKVLVRVLLGERFFYDWQVCIGQVPTAAKNEEALQ